MTRNHTKPKLLREKALKSSLDAYVLVAPAIVIFALFVVYPLLRTVGLSFYKYGLTSRQIEFIGIQNYITMLHDPIFWRSIKNNILILLGSVIFQVGGGLILAAVLNRGIRYGKTFFRTVFFGPMVMSAVAVALLWQLVYDPNVGILNATLKFLHLPTPSQGWLGDPKLVMFSILVVACWQYTGFMMVILLAGMQSVSPELYEAAKLDGANGIQSFLWVTIPMIRNVIIVAVLITMIGAFKVFDLVYVLTRGGPANASQVLGSYIYYNAFTVSQAGYASALSVVLLIFALVLGFVQLRTSRDTGQ